MKDMAEPEFGRLVTEAERTGTKEWVKLVYP